MGVFIVWSEALNSAYITISQESSHMHDYLSHITLSDPSDGYTREPINSLWLHVVLEIVPFHSKVDQSEQCENVLMRMVGLFSKAFRMNPTSE